MIYGDNPKDPLGLNRYTPDISAIRQSGNLYLYCSNNPIMYVDPTGQNDLRLHQIFAWLDRGAKWLKNGGAAVVSICMGLVPLAGEGIDAKEAFTGEEFLTGEPLSTGERFMSGGAALLPFVSGPMLRSVGKAFKNGELFERSIKLGNGANVSAIAETVVNNKTLTLKDIAIYSNVGDIPNTVGPSQFIDALGAIKQQAIAEGFETLVITGQRVANSTSTNPGKEITITINLIKKGN